jgi:uncharacterized protein (DUF433 family)
MITQSRYITSDPDILGGTPVFAGTRVPFSYLMGYLEEGSTTSQFVVDYPSVTLELAEKALQEAASVVDDFAHAHTIG